MSDDIRRRALSYARAPMPPSVLLIEDDDSTGETILLLLRQAGYHCTRVATATEARSLLAGNFYGAVVADQRLPDGDGWTIAGDVPKPTALILMSGILPDEGLEALRRRTRADAIVSFDRIEDVVGVVGDLLPPRR